MNDNNICKTVSYLYIALSVVYIGFIFFFDKNYYIRICSVFFVIICWVISTVFILMLRRRIVDIYKRFDTYIDNIILGKEDILFDLESDDLLSKFQYKLKSLYNFMRDNNKKIKKEKEEIERFISDISHQVKTPMANLKLYNSTLIERDLDKETVISFLNLMKNQLDKLEFLIQSLIKISRLENGLIHINIKDISIYETIAYALGNIFMAAQEKEINVEIKCDSKIIVKHDPKWTSEAIFNILDNAVKYTPKRGNIKIEVIELEMFTKIEISDDGIGINNENICKIFDRFYREEEVSNISGIGIGLYLARKIVTMEGGYIKVKSKKGKGSIFSIFLLKN